MSTDWALVPTPVPFATLDNPQSLNLYSYVGNNPLSKRDVHGHSQECDSDKSTNSVENGVQTVTVTAGACREVSDGPWWLAFNPWGRLGGPTHRYTVQKLSEMLRNEGYDVQTEVRVPTPMGAKQTRYVDVVGVKKDTGETKMYQVGDRNKDGQPVGCSEGWAVHGFTRWCCYRKRYYPRRRARVHGLSARKPSDLLEHL
jgi:hypothetical protein